MRICDILDQKKRGHALSREEIRFFVDGFTRGDIADYQASALCMAVCINGMTAEECADLTEAMADSGDQIDLSSLSHTADKHSTGGVGDLTSLIVAPLAASMGLSVAKMSGRGLGHTGGTIDKLESIPGLRTSLSEDEFLAQVRQIGVAIVGATANLAPADKKLYALRDVTATVDSIPLIASSVMSKKLASGAESIVLDVKYGSGAFMKTADDARELARSMTAIGRVHGRRMAAIVSSMEFPLAPMIGNTLEVEQAVKILRGEDAPGWGIRTAALRLGAEMFSLSTGASPEEALREAEEHLTDGRAYAKFLAWIAAQGGDVSYIEENRFRRSACVREIPAWTDGFFTSADTEKIGLASCLCGAGRMVKEDIPDLGAGLLLHVAPNGAVRRGQPLATLYAADGDRLDAGEEMLREALSFTDKPAAPIPLIADVIQ
ncbi:MAG: thymidine phosphorylase [Clostridiales bacterium]|nr:thymidine phosphorylase [Clostridiales bacterium]